MMCRQAYNHKIDVFMHNSLCQSFNDAETCPVRRVDGQYFQTNFGKSERHCHSKWTFMKGSIEITHI